jgi:hypothetical protein
MNAKKTEGNKLCNKKQKMVRTFVTSCSRVKMLRSVEYPKQNVTMSRYRHEKEARLLLMKFAG